MFHINQKDFQIIIDTYINQNSKSRGELCKTPIWQRHTRKLQMEGEMLSNGEIAKVIGDLFFNKEDFYLP